MRTREKRGMTIKRKHNFWTTSTSTSRISFKIEPFILRTKSNFLQPQLFRVPSARKRKLISAPNLSLMSVYCCPLKDG